MFIVILLSITCGRGFASFFLQSSVQTDVTTTDFYFNTRLGVCEYAKANDVTIGLDLPQSFVIEDLPITSKEKTWFMSLHPTLQTRPKPLVRKDIRQFSEKERSNLIDALWSMKTNFIDDATQFDLFSNIHLPKYGPAQDRSGPGQYNWHREFLIRFEEALLRQNPNSPLMYWDISRDADLPKSYDSIIFGDDYFGGCGTKTSDGSYMGSIISNGPFADWPGSEFCNVDGGIMRACGYATDHLTFRNSELSVLLNYTSYREMYRETAACFVADHDLLHYYLVSLTNDPAQTANATGDKRCGVMDPITWAFHCFIDLVWQEFRVKHQTTNLETDYPEDNELLDMTHSATAEMYPFNMYVKDGLSTDYEYFYLYEARKSDCESNSDCGNTESFFCNKSSKQCMSRILTGGQCEDEDSDMCQPSNTCNGNNICIRQTTSS